MERRPAEGVAPRAAGRPETPATRVAVDIGGTFTDFVVWAPGAADLRTFKVLSTPDDPARAVLAGLGRVLAGASEARPSPSIVHGSTVATNAVLERKGARTALVATAGFRDLLAIGRQARPELYDLMPRKPRPLVPADLAFEVDERVDHRGRVLRPLEDAEIDRVVAEIHASGAESVAVCLLFSFLRPEHERRLGERLREEGLAVSLSCDVLPEFREYERASATAINAYVSPVLGRYLGRLAREGPRAAWRVMQSNGGSVGLEAAGREGVRAVLSGPAGGVVGALHAAGACGWGRIIGFDMGGTSTDVCLAEGRPRVTREGTLDGLPIGVPVVDLHSVGSGGGSVARVDVGGALRVGPESAGADPGPACYGRGGDRPTVTDANLVLGRMDPEGFLGGTMRLDEEAARAAFGELAERAGLEPPPGLSPEQAAALGVVRVANAHMERALRVISVQRGHDPADFTLVAFGGAGGLHASALARALGIGRVLVPRTASVLSAHGMLAADVTRDYGLTVMLPGTTGADRLREGFAPLERRAREAMEGEGSASGLRLERSLAMRYRGQSWELDVPLDDDPPGAFHAAHRDAYGHADAGAATEIVGLRLRAVLPVRPPELPEAEEAGPDPGAALDGERPVVLVAAAGATVEPVPFYRASALRPGHRLAGPAVIVRDDTTLFLGRGDEATVTSRLDIVVGVAGTEVGT
ncbi:MAG: hydantoinase/oxoprolinase family protein [Candidatus Palauibacterales bacterium]|nr:hydantoinase/oxoprolinase family protein [Candidatus Palauibacterales bacterium]MDP2528972.1 hydantoinase/oxoprolinase family protein [Candidatus Palauibacterales bacterium]MDP2583790.1 hydantoinase/oxoprolinase family protein [Candidatus Palauibacterales bacterium]